MTWPQDAYVGQKVVCVHGHPYGPKENEIYTISYIGNHPWDTQLGFSLYEAPSIDFPPHWYAWRFRPVQSTSTGFALLRALLNPANHRHREDA